MNQDYKLVFYENFDNLDNWNFNTGSGLKNLWGNHEKEFYTNRKENIYIKNNKLYIIGRKENYEDCNYTSARITTKDKKNFKYGYIEIKAKLLMGKGSWPALWMMGQNGSWPVGGEIDIMEHVGINQDMIYHTIHSKNHICQPYFSYKEIINDGSKEFHKYGMLWKENYIEFFVDDISYGKITNDKYTKKEDWPFNNYFYFIINLAAGGDFAGDIVDEDLPFVFVVDYIKVYQKNSYWMSSIRSSVSNLF